MNKKHTAKDGLRNLVPRRRFRCPNPNTLTRHFPNLEMHEFAESGSPFVVRDAKMENPRRVHYLRIEPTDAFCLLVHVPLRRSKVTTGIIAVQLGPNGWSSDNGAPIPARIIK
jgi:hypothetical protein